VLVLDAAATEATAIESGEDCTAFWFPRACVFGVELACRCVFAACAIADLPRSVWRAACFACPRAWP
jgi:hypothetical protein